MQRPHSQIQLQAKHEEEHWNGELSVCTCESCSERKANLIAVKHLLAITPDACCCLSCIYTEGQQVLTAEVHVQIAGGSGITPMYQVAQEILRNPEDKTQVSLIFANQTEQDIILRKELDDLAAKHDNFQVS